MGQRFSSYLTLSLESAGLPAPIPVHCDSNVNRRLPENLADQLSATIRTARSDRMRPRRQSVSPDADRVVIAVSIWMASHP